MGIGYAVSWLSTAHADYFRLGGVDGFIGDGKVYLLEALAGGRISSGETGPDLA